MWKGGERSLGYSQIHYGDIIIRGNKVYRPIPSNAGMLLQEAGGALVGISGVVKHFKLACPMIVWNWVKAGMPCAEVAGRKVFDLLDVACWLQSKGYDLDKLKAGKGARNSHVREGEDRWRKGQMSPPPPAGTRTGRKRKQTSGTSKIRSRERNG
jgi:hypothetical protein